MTDWAAYWVENPELRVITATVYLLSEPPVDYIQLSVHKTRMTSPIWWPLWTAPHTTHSSHQFKAKGDVAPSPDKGRTASPVPLTPLGQRGWGTHGGSQTQGNAWALTVCAVGQGTWGKERDTGDLADAWTKGIWYPS